MQDMNVSSDPQVLKRRLRTRMAALREMMGAEARARADAVLAEQACAHPAYLEADVVFTYLSTGNEVDTRAIIRDAWKRGKTVAIPRCVPEKHAMQWYRIDDFEGLEKGSYGIEEPSADPARRVEAPVREAAAGEGAAGEDGAPARAVAFVPGYTFDRQGFRVGYGGGYYDVFLSEFDGTSIGLCRAEQRSDEPIPCSENDIPVTCTLFG